MNKEAKRKSSKKIKAKESKMLTLPVELVTTIFKSLPIKQILICKKVCKQWRAVIEQYVKLDKLVIVSLEERVIENRRYFNTNQPVDCLHLISRVNFKLINAQSTKSIFTNLKQLYISNKNICLEFLNNFQNLQHLEINLNYLSAKDKSNDLNLPKLRILSLCYVKLPSRLIISTPKLEKLRFYASYRSAELKFNHPESVKLVECSVFKDYLKSFVNLEYLYCDQLKDAGDFLAGFSKLKQIQFNYKEDQQKQIEFISNPDQRLFDDSEFDKLIKQKRQLKRNDLIVYYAGIDFGDELPAREQIYELTPFDQIGRALNNVNIIRFYSDNQQNLADVLPFIKTVDYNDFEDYFGKINFDHLCKKLVGLEKVKISKKVNDVAQLIEFLKVCDRFHVLSINADSLSQDFFDEQLPLACPNIDFLVLKNSDKLDLKFLLKLNRLGTLDTRETFVDASCTKKLFKKFKYLTVSHEGCACFLSIDRNRHGQFGLHMNDEQDYLFKNLTDLYKFYFKFGKHYPFWDEDTNLFDDRRFDDEDEDEDSDY